MEFRIFRCGAAASKGVSRCLFVCCKTIRFFILTYKEVSQKCIFPSGTVLEWTTREGDSPVRERSYTYHELFLSRAGHVKPCLKLGGLLPKAKYFSRPIVN